MLGLVLNEQGLEEQVEIHAKPIWKMAIGEKMERRTIEVWHRGVLMFISGGPPLPDSNEVVQKVLSTSNNKLRRG
jgi:hypothetical protein